MVVVTVCPLLLSPQVFANKLVKLGEVFPRLVGGWWSHGGMPRFVVTQAMLVGKRGESRGYWEAHSRKSLLWWWWWVVGVGWLVGSGVGWLVGFF